MATTPPKTPYDPTQPPPLPGQPIPAPTTGATALPATTPPPTTAPAPAAPAAPTTAPAPTTTPAPTGALPANQALAQAQQAAQTRLGRPLTQQEIDVLRTQPGVANPDGTFNIQAALGLINKYSGNLSNPWGPATPAAAPVPTKGAVEDEYRTQLMALLQGKVPVTLDQNNPALVAERTAFDRANQRATTRQRLAASERAAARGTLGAGGFDAELAGIEQGAGDRSTGFEAELLRNERQGQIDRLMQALGMGQQYSLTNQGYTLQGQLGRGQLGLGYLNAMLGNQQANNNLGFNYAALQNQMNNQALQALLAGM